MSREKFHACVLGDMPNKIRYLMQLLITPREFYNWNGQMHSKVHTGTSRTRIIKIFFRIKILKKSLSVMLIFYQSRLNGIGKGKRNGSMGQTTENTFNAH